MATVFVNRINKLQKLLQCQKIHHFLITNPIHLFYLTGVHGLEGKIVASPTKSILLTDARYIERVQHLSFFALVELKNFKKDIEQLIKKHRIKKMSFESTHVTYAQLLALRKMFPSMLWKPAKQTIEALRLVKTNDEITQIQKACTICDRAFAVVKKYIKPGRRENEVAWYIEQYLRQRGVEDLAFRPIIVASGSNAAIPHHHTSSKKLKKGELVIIDFGAKVGGYCSDMTRTIVLSPLTTKTKELYEIVARAQKAALKNIKVGVTGKQADGFAREIIDQAGYNEKFAHSLGHGVGLEIHEGPHVSRLSKEILLKNSVITVEPGIYVKGVGGVRIEDTIVVQNKGVDILTKSPKKLFILDN